MTDDEILEMADQFVADNIKPAASWRLNDVLLNFARLIITRQKEIDAGICDGYASCEGIAQKCAEAIRSQK
jgi:hypothetical protein